VKNAVCKYLDGEDAERLDQMEILERMLGWNILLNQKCNQNLVHDVLALNPLACLKSKEHLSPCKNSFVYAAWLKPGYHQFVIYEPIEERAFCQEIFVEPSRYEAYPELPKQMAHFSIPTKVVSVFAKWDYFNLDHQKKAFTLDTMPFKLRQEGSRKTKKADNFEPEKYMKN